MNIFINIIFAALITQSLAYAVKLFQNNILGPKKKADLQSQPSLTGLKRNGFIAASHIDVGDGSSSDEAVGYTGQINGYAVEIAYNFLSGIWKTVPYFRVRVFFDTQTIDPASLQAQLTDNMSRSKMFRWSTEIKLTVNYAETKVIRLYGTPDSQDLFEAAQRLVNEFQKLNLKPITYKAGVEVLQKLAE